MSSQLPVPGALKNWFVAHCVIDLLFAVPLMFFPETFLEVLEWPYFDPLSVRIAAAALAGIGLESYFGRNASREAYLGMLRLKVIWSFCATAGILLAMWSIPAPKPAVGWLLAAVFAGFHLLWLYWRRRLLRT